MADLAAPVDGLRRALGHHGTHGLIGAKIDCGELGRGKGE